ncbi:MAG: hypothetical protein AAGE80_15970 [Pseudomonadota bacterium]
MKGAIGDYFKERVDRIVGEAVHQLAGEDGDEPYVREAIAKVAVREFTWRLRDAFPDEAQQIAEQLGLMSRLLEQSIVEDDPSLED